MASHQPINMPSYCRDCASEVNTRPCPTCGSHRLISHAELDQLSIAHIDCDAFFCSVEKRDRPELAHKPVVVGGGQRGVVAAACYQARLYGVHSAMPMFKAKAACPNLVIIRGDYGKYAREGARIKEMMRELTPLVEPLSIDEAFLDLTGTERLHGLSPAQSLIQLQNHIEKEVGITVSVGLSHNKFLAKTASDLDKPHGFAVIGKAETLDFLAPKAVSFIYGIGPSFARKLKKSGIETIADVRRRSDADMAKKFGDLGLHLARLSRGEDSRKVNPVSIRKSVSAETTFSQDISDLETLKDRLWLMCVKASDQAKAKNIAGRVVTLKLKTRSFETFTRRRTLEQPVQLADTLFHALEPLLEKEANGRKFRLIGAGFSDLSDPVGDQGSLLDPVQEKRGKAERASDIARAKFGRDAIMTGRGLRQKIARQTRPEDSSPTKKE